MHIRSYSPSDWDRLCAIHDTARLDELRHSVGVDAFLSLAATYKNEGLFDADVDVAEINAVIEGFIAYSAQEITWLYVSPACYRKGVGRSLLRHAMGIADRPLRVEVLEGNEPARRLYLSEGFVVVDRVNGNLQGNEQFHASGLILEHPGS